MKSVSQFLKEKHAEKLSAEKAENKEFGRLVEIAQQYADSFMHDHSVLPDLEISIRTNVIMLYSRVSRRRLDIKVIGDSAFELRYEPPPEMAILRFDAVTEDEMLEAVIAFSRDP